MVIYNQGKGKAHTHRKGIIKMMYAQEAKTIAHNVAHERIEARKQKAKHIVETQIAKAILEACTDAQHSTKVHIDASIDRDVVMELLSEYGYSVKNNGNMISISWF